MTRAAGVRSLLLAFAFCRAARAEQLPIKSYTTAEGLPSDRIHCILPDSNGFLWIGTEDGLSRFDGYAFRNISSADGLPSASVTAIAEARDGVYWIGTSSGLARLDGARESANGRPAMSVRHLEAGAASDRISALLMDRAGTLWIGTEAGLFRLGRDARSFERVAEAVTDVTSLAGDPAAALWIGSEYGLFQRSPSGAVERVGGAEGAPKGVRSLAIDRHGVVWAGSWRNLFAIEVDSAGVGRLRGEYGPKFGLAGDHMAGLHETKDGRLWVACYGGLSEISPDRSTIRSYTTSEGLSGLAMNAVAEDRDGNLWIGAGNTGLMRLARDGFLRFDERDGLRSTRVGSLFLAGDGSVCAFTRGRRLEEVLGHDGFLECFDGRRFATQEPLLPAGTQFGWGWSQVTLQDHLGEWWVPTLTGLYRYPAVPFSRLGTTAPRRVYTTRDGLPDDRLFRLYEDRRGDLWIGVIGEKANLARWDRGLDRIEAFSAAQGVPPRQPMSFAEDSSGGLWIGLREGGLLRWRGGRMRLFETAEGLPAGSIRALLYDRAGRLWLGSSRSGVARIDQTLDDAPRFVRIAGAEGVSSESVSSLAEDLEGHVYVGTERGLDRIDPDHGTVERFTTDDGLARGTVEVSVRDRQGRLWFGSTEGLSRLAPARELRPPSPPVRVRITGLLVNGVRQPVSELGAERLELPRSIREPMSVQIDFVGIEFAPGGRPRYQYRVDGLDRDWSAPAAQPSVVYARLPAGGYRFRVRAISNDAVHSPEEAVVAFSVLPSFWKRPEVLAAIGLAAAAIAYALHRSRLRHVVAIERVRARVARDLHDDVGSGLSEIAILSEVARHGSGNGGPDSALREIGDAARRLVDAMSDIVWATDPRHDDASSLVARIRHFAANTLDTRQISWSMEVPPGFEARTLDAEARRQILLIVKEALTNIARHSRCTRAALRISGDPTDAVIEIVDDGRGFATDAPRNGGNGLANMRSRALSLDGSFRVDSRPSGGTRIEIRVPLERPVGPPGPA